MPVSEKFPIITTERLILLAPGSGFASGIAALAGEFEIADTTLRIPHPYTLQDAEAWIRQCRNLFRSGRAIQWLLCLHKDQTLIGAIGLSDIDRIHRHAELGYWIGKPWWNQGYATEACRALLHYTFEELRLHRVYAHHFTRNPASGKVLQKIGMTWEGKLKEHVIRWQRFEDLELFGIINPADS